MNFCPEFYGHVERCFDKNAMINLKIYNVINWEIIITIHILSNILRSKDNEAIKSGQLIECNVRIFFFKNHAKTEAGKLVPRSKDMLLNFDFLEKDLGLASLPHFLSS